MHRRPAPPGSAAAEEGNDENQVAGRDARSRGGAGGGAVGRAGLPEQAGPHRGHLPAGRPDRHRGPPVRADAGRSRGRLRGAAGLRGGLPGTALRALGHRHRGLLQRLREPAHDGLRVVRARPAELHDPAALRQHGGPHHRLRALERLRRHELLAAARGLHLPEAVPRPRLARRGCRPRRGSPRRSGCCPRGAARSPRGRGRAAAALPGRRGPPAPGAPRGRAPARGRLVARAARPRLAGRRRRGRPPGGDPARRGG